MSQFFLMLSSVLFISKAFLFSETSFKNAPASNSIAYIKGDDNPKSKLGYKLEKYYKFINLASREIYKNDFFCATAFYDSAFVYKSNPNYVDLKNYILVNYKCGFFDKNNAAIRMLLKGKQLDTAYLFAELPKRVFNTDNLELINRLQTEKDKKKKIENNLQKTMREIYIMDQANLLDFSIKDYKKAKSIKDSVARDNALRFIKVYEKEGFPTEEKMGVFYEKGMEWSFITYILLGNFIKGEEREKILNIIEIEFKLGNLHPSHYASLLDLANENSKVRKPAFNFMNTTVELVEGTPYRPFVYYSDSLMSEVNTNRLSIGLDSFHVAQKQVICSKFCNTINPDLYTETSIIPMAQYAKLDIENYGFVKAAFDKEQQDLNAYKINTKKILKECNCAEKFY